jgi:exosome complex component RRP4
VVAEQKLRRKVFALVHTFKGSTCISVKLLSPNKMAAFENQMVVPGDTIADDVSKFLHGHGTYVRNGHLIASVAGVVQRVNQLLFVRPFHARYGSTGDVSGDVVVGRIVEVAAKKWNVDAGAASNAVLLLDQVNLLGNEQRRRTHADSLQMRSMFDVGDIVIAFAQEKFADGAFSLRIPPGNDTTSIHNKFGKAGAGVLVIVSPNLVVRSNQHFVRLACGVECVMGRNGYIWLHPPVPAAAAAEVSNPGVSDPGEVAEIAPISQEMREKIASSSAAISLLNIEGLCISMPSSCFAIALSQILLFCLLYFHALGHRHVFIRKCCKRARSATS